MDSAHRISKTLDSPSATDAVALDGIAQRLGRSWAVRGVTLRIPAGELVAIVGHNGSGKTTLLRIISTVLRPTRGEGSVFGADLKRQPEQVRESVAMLTHGAGLYGDLTATENLQFAQRMAGQPRNDAAIALVLDRVGLTRAANERVRTYSSGMQRRASLARLFLRSARLLLLDEPYNSLDPLGGRLVDELLIDARARGGSGLVVLHDLDRSGVTFDRIVELRDGRVVRVERRAPKPFCQRATAGV